MGASANRMPAAVALACCAIAGC